MLANSTTNYLEMTIPTGQLNSQNPSAATPGDDTYYLWEFDFPGAVVGDRALANAKSYAPAATRNNRAFQTMQVSAATVTAAGKVRISFKLGGTLRDGEIPQAPSAFEYVFSVTLVSNTGEQLAAV